MTDPHPRGSLLAEVWKLLYGRRPGRILWRMHHKFVIGTSGVVLDDQGRVLLLRHVFWRTGSWGLPSGDAKREETGLQIEIFALWRVASGYKLRIEASYLAKVTGGSLMLDSREVIEARFFPVNQLPSGLLDAHRELIQLLIDE